MTAVWVYVHDLRSSGVVRNAILLARRLAADYPTTLVAGSDEGLFRDEAAAGPFDLVVLSRRGGRLAAAWQLRRWLGQQPAGVLLSAGNLGHSTAFAGSMGFAHVRRIFRISNEIAGREKVKGMLRRWWMGRLIASAERIVLVGGALASSTVFAAAIRSGRAVSIANGVDLTRAAVLATAPPPHPWLTELVPVVLAIGRLRPQKNLDLLIDAVGRARRTQRLRLAILGGGTAAEQARLHGFAAKADLGEDFLLAGETANVFAWLARAAVFALPSRWEGSSMALLEALAVGVPVVAARTAGDATLVLGDGRYGRLVAGGDADELAAALLAQCGDAAVRPGRRALDHALDRTLDIYADIVREVAVAGCSPAP